MAGDALLNRFMPNRPAQEEQPTLSFDIENPDPGTLANLGSAINEYARSMREDSERKAYASSVVNPPVTETSPDIEVTRRSPLLQKLFSKSKIDADIADLTETRGRLFDRIEAPARIGGAEKIGSILSALASFGVGYAVGGGGQMGLGLALSGAGASGKSFWDRIDAENEKQNLILEMRLKDNILESSQLSKRSIDVDNMMAKIEVDRLENQDKLEGEKELLRLRNQGQESRPEVVDAINKIVSGENVDLTTLNLNDKETSRVLQAQRIGQQREMLGQRQTEEKRRSDALSAQIEGRYSRPIPDKTGEGVIEAKSIMMDAAIIEDKINEIYKDLPKGPAGRVASSQLLKRVPTTQLQLIRDWLDFTGTKIGLSIAGKQGFSDRDREVFTSFLAGEGAFAASELIPRFKKLRDMKIELTLTALKRELSRDMYNRDASHVASMFIDEIRNEVGEEAARSAQTYLFGDKKKRLTYEEWAALKKEGKL